MKNNITINREEFRNKILPKYYSPFLHLAFNFSSIIGSIIFCMVSIKEPESKDALILTSFILLNSLVVYFTHRYPMHRRYKLFKMYFWFHTQQHHHLFNEENNSVHQFRDIYMVLFPPSLVAFFAFFYVPAISYSLYYFTSLKLGLLFALSMYIYFLLYEIFHFASHCHEKSWFYQIPGISKMFWHHRKHHDPKIMIKRNFGIVLPLWDYIFKTKV